MLKLRFLAKQRVKMADFSSLPQIDKIINLQCFKNAPKPIIARFFLGLKAPFARL